MNSDEKWWEANSSFLWNLTHLGLIYVGAVYWVAFCGMLQVFRPTIAVFITRALKSLCFVGEVGAHVSRGLTSHRRESKCSRSTDSHLLIICHGDHVLMNIIWCILKGELALTGGCFIRAQAHTCLRVARGRKYWCRETEECDKLHYWIGFSENVSYFFYE